MTIGGASGHDKDHQLSTQWSRGTGWDTGVVALGTKPIKRSVRTNGPIEPAETTEEHPQARECHELTSG